MSVTVTSRGSCLTAALSGDIDHHGARTMMRELEEIISEELPRRLELDLSDVSFMDSSGIALLLMARRQMEHAGGTLRAVHIPAQARRVLDAAGVGRLVPLE